MIPTNLEDRLDENFKAKTVKMIGNAVAVNMAKALVSSILEENGGFSL